MLTKRLALRAALASATAVITSVAFADLTDTFDPPNGNATSNGTPTIQTGGPTGDFLRLLTDGVNGQTSHYAYDLTDSGSFSNVNIQWDFRAESLTGSPADGFSLMLVPTSLFGTTGIGPQGFELEKPSTNGTIGFGFDLYPGLNDASVHWDGVERHNRGVNTGEFDFDSGTFGRANLSLSQVGNSTNFTLTLTSDIHGTPGTPTTALNGVISTPLYESRLQFSGRTGGLNVGVDLDNVSATYADPSPVLDSVTHRGIFQDFDSAGSTNFSAAHFENTPGPKAVTGGPTGTYLRLTSDGIGGQRNAIALDNAKTLTNAESFSMDFRLTDSLANGSADGLGIAFLPQDVHGTAGQPRNDLFEVPNGGAGERILAVGFALFPNINDVSLHYDGTELIRNNVDPGILDLDSGIFHNVEVLRTETESGGQFGTQVVVNVIPDVNGVPGAPVQVINEFVAGLTSNAYRVHVGARTGGVHIDADIDNIQSNFIVNERGSPYTMQSFDAAGTNYQAVGYSGAKGPEIRTDGPDGRYLRLVHNEGGTVNSVGFAATGDTVADFKDRVIVEADFRMGADEGGQRADGFGIGLMDVNAYGMDGLAPDTAQAAWETPAFSDMLSVGFAIYEQNNVRLYLDGAELLNVAVTEQDFNNNLFNQLRLTLENNGDDTLATLEIIWDKFGTADATTVFEDVTVAGFNLDEFDFRLGIGGRTGGAFTNMDFDNVFAAIPEPSHFAIVAGLLVLFLAARSRRSR